MTFFKKSVFAAALAATALTSAAPAMADGYRGDYHRGGDGAGLAIGAGIAGLAIGAIIASNSHPHDRYYADDAYYANRQVRPYWVWHDGYYWDRDGNRYDRYYREGYHGYDRRGYGAPDYREHDYREHDYRGHDYREQDRGYAHDEYRGEQHHYDGGRGY